MSDRDNRVYLEVSDEIHLDFENMSLTETSECISRFPMKYTGILKMFVYSEASTQASECM